MNMNDFIGFIKCECTSCDCKLILTTRRVCAHCQHGDHAESTAKPEPSENNTAVRS